MFVRECVYMCACLCECVCVGGEGKERGVRGLGGFCRRHQPAAARLPRRLWLIGHYPQDLLYKLCLILGFVCIYVYWQVHLLAFLLLEDNIR